MDTLPPVNHIFVDFENVHEVDLSLIGQKSIHVTVLVGAKQTKVETGLVEKLLQHAGSIHLVRLLESGKNALDFAIAYYVGRAAVLDPSGFFHIISADTGYDPLVAHLRRNHIRAHRHETYATLKEMINRANTPASAPETTPSTPAPAKPTPTPKAVHTNAPKEPSLDANAARVLEHLRSHAKNRPTGEKKLAHHIPSMLGKGATEADAQQVIHALRAAKKIAINEKGRVTYHL